MSSQSSQLAAESAETLRRMNGVVYTPASLASFVLQVTLEEQDNTVGPLLDPSCGEGVFLVEAVRLIAGQFERQGVDIQGPARIDFLEAVAETLFGVDIDSAAVEITRIAVVRLVEELAPGPLPENYLQRNFIAADFLTDSLDDLLTSSPRLIVGNPPYVTTSSIDPAKKELLRGKYLSAWGRIDLYTLFMQRATELLPANGRWCFITPDKYLSSISARPIREVLGSVGTVRKVFTFSSHKVFAQAATVPCVTLWEKALDSQPMKIGAARMSHKSNARVEIYQSHMIPPPRGNDWDWRRGPESHTLLADELRREHPTLAEMTKRVSAGIATGLNAAFLVKPGEDHGIEPALLHDSVRGRDVKAFDAQSSRQMLMPYQWDSQGRSHLIDLGDYPGAAAWLATFRAQLEDRHCVRSWNKKWWDLHDPVTFPIHKTEKVLVPDVARGNRFAADEGHLVPENTSYYIVPEDISSASLTAILNSKPIEFLVKTTAPLVKDGFYRYRRQFLLDLPIPQLTKEDDDELATALAVNDFDRVEKTVWSIFGVDETRLMAALESLEVDALPGAIVVT